MFGHLRKTRAQLIEILQYHCALEFYVASMPISPKLHTNKKALDGIRFAFAHATNIDQTP